MRRRPRTSGLRVTPGPRLERAARRRSDRARRQRQEQTAKRPSVSRLPADSDPGRLDVTGPDYEANRPPAGNTVYGRDRWLKAELAAGGPRYLVGAGAHITDLYLAGESDFRPST